MSSKPITIQPSAYQSLLKQVRKTLLDGQARIEAERVRVYWDTGHLIQTHLKQNKARADYGTEVIKNLSRDLDIDDSTLQRCVQFAKKYTRSQIVGTGRQFTWSHYRKLIAVADDRERVLFENSVRKNLWSSKELAVRIKAVKGISPAEQKETPVTQTPLTPARGTIYTYRFVSRPNLGPVSDRPLLLDLGFGVFRDIEPRTAARFQDQAVVESRLKDGQYTFSAGDRTAKDLFTYKAYIEKVVDGDTLKVRIDQGFDIWNRQVLRLRDIDCPEVGTKEGDAARAFARSLLKEASLIVLRSSKSDKYDRYLADIFIPQGKEPDPATDVYLNNLLLEKGYAQRV